MGAHAFRVATIISGATLTGCLHLRPAPAPLNRGDRVVITQKMIEESKGRNAWEVLRIEAPQFTFQERPNGDPAVLERRGRSSFLLNDAPQLYLDGVRLTDLKNLEQIDASTLQRIEILGALNGTTYYGTDAEGGVILLFSKDGRSS
jgi:outer membrane cobalamin receptor